MEYLAPPGGGSAMRALRFEAIPVARRSIRLCTIVHALLSAGPDLDHSGPAFNSVSMERRMLVVVAVAAVGSLVVVMFALLVLALSRPLRWTRARSRASLYTRSRFERSPRWRTRAPLSLVWGCCGV